MLIDRLSKRFVVHLPFSVAQRVSVLAVCVDDRPRVESFLVDSLVSLCVGNLNVELAQCRQLIVFVTVDSKISHPGAAIPFP